MTVGRSRTLVICIAALVAGAAGCGGASMGGTPAGTAGAGTGTAPYVPADGGGGGTTAPAKVDPIDVVVANGAVTGGGRTEVTLGSRVAIQVTSDVADEVHLHGYDLKVDAQAGTPAVIDFTADIPGVFEVELESQGLKLLDLVVR